jgi:hypothetical protein
MPDKQKPRLVGALWPGLPLWLTGRWIAGSVLLASLQQAVDQCGGFIAELLAHQLERIFPR